jgi:hypothetical protein
VYRSLGLTSTDERHEKLRHDDVKPGKAMSAEAKFVVALAVLLAVAFGRLLSDREPMQKEMTFAYRKHFVAISGSTNPKELGGVYARLHATELVKQRCDKLGDRRYRCEAIVLIDDSPVAGHQAAENAIYSHDGKGWSFEAIGAE